MTKQEILTNWKELREALASGRYEKGKNSLRSFNKFCCLGVATDLKIKESGCDLSKWEKGHSYYNDENKSPYLMIENIAIFYGLKELPDLFDRNPLTKSLDIMLIHSIIHNDTETISGLNDESDNWEPIIEEIDKIIDYIETKEF